MTRMAAAPEDVRYWRMTATDAETQSEDLSGPSSSEEDSEEYETLHPSDSKTQQILAQSEFYGKFMPSTDRVSESLLQFCSSFPVRMGPVILASLVRRFTDARFNWATKTLQSFLEVTCWVSVTGAAYSLYHDWMFALQVGTFVGALMSVCDEVVLQFVRGLARVIRNQHGGSELLEKLGFDVPKNGKAPTNGHEVELIKTLVFGFLGVVVIRSLWENFHDVKYFALLTAAAGVAFVVTAEFFCLWLPTRRVGLTLQSRFTKIRENWQDHPLRSFVELMTWLAATSYFLYKSDDFLLSLQLGTVVAVAVSLVSGLEELPTIVSSDEIGEYSVWQTRASSDPFLSVAKGLVSVQDAFIYARTAMENEAMNMYENWSQ
ncbi:hypothetical protein Poli38472_003697 [Pythium oligandrum]|uniref:Uncharacterized protein n=1 Tax=Pythium oligandrum TaxID=41045 RepID=A0A8K1CLX3_PYTOL|nr:hypothetical protein Poli38472_003697 [Pythium oligandrum]|eukprot:TMW65932.1 hypothetical protein Poli38472_003697 [Pythium oligandrum]